MEYFITDIPDYRMQGHYNFYLVALSYAIAVLASYVALELSSNLKASSKSYLTVNSLWWLIGGSLAMGSGIWSMHFIGMLALYTNMPIQYEFGMTTFSLFIAFALSFFAMLIIKKGVHSYKQLFNSGLLIGLGISAMHYTGMAAMDMAAEIKYIPIIYALSIAIAILAAIAALWLADKASKQSPGKKLGFKIYAALVMGGAICGMHYTGMEATVFIPTANHVHMVEDTASHNLLAFAVSIITAVILAIFILASIINQKFIQTLQTELLARTEAISRANKKLKHMQKKSLINEMRANLIVDYALDAIVIINSTGIIESFNHAAEKMFGYTREEAIGKNVSILMGQEHQKKHDEYIKKFLRTGEKNVIGQKSRQLPAVKKDGEEFYVQLGVVELTIEKEVIFIGVLHDITEQKEREESLEQAKLSAENAARLKSDFLANMSHEIRTPMNAVIGMTGLLLDTQLKPEQKSYVEVLRSSGEALLDIINEVLDFSKIEAGELSLENAPFNLFDSLQDVMEIMKYRAREKNLELQFFPDLNMPVYYIGDVARIRQVILNLFSNALKFTENGYILLRSWHEELPGGKARAFFEVEDTGIGIPEDKLDYIFNKFSQAEESTTRKYGGTGLGLAICKRLTEMMGGDIGVRSNLDHGTTFYFDIELLVQGACSQSYLKMHQSSHKEEMLSRSKFLVIDGKPEHPSFLCELLRKWDLNFERVASAGKAIQSIDVSATSKEPYDVVIIDDHFEQNVIFDISKKVLEKYKACNLPVKMVLLSKNVNEILEKEAEKHGFAAVLSKPLFPSFCFNALNTIVHAEDKKEDEKFITEHDIKHASDIESQCGSGELIEDFSGLRILVVDDMPINQMLMVNMFKKYQGRVDTAANGLEAVEMTDKLEYDIVFMDCQMPEMDGFEATQVIREREQSTRKHVTIVALTADAMDGDKEKCLKIGMDAYLNKPVRPHEIVKVINDFCFSSKSDAASNM